MKKATDKASEKEIAVKEGINAPIKLNVTDAALTKLKKKFEKLPDVTTKDGYEVIRLGLGELRTIRTGAGKHKAGLKAEAIAYNKRVDVAYNHIVDAVAAMETPWKDAKDAEDAKKEALKEEKKKKEETRKFAINQKINEIREIAFSFTDETSEAIRKQIDEVKGIQITKDVYEEFVTAAQMAVIDVKTKLEALLENVVKREEADAERKLEDARLADERKKLDDEKEEAAKEVDRLKTITDNLDHIKGLPFEYTGSAASGIDLGIASLEAMVITEDEFGEFLEEAKASKESVLEKLGIIKKQAKEMEELQKKKEALDEREKKADEEKEAAAEELRLKEEKETQEKKDKKALKENKKLAAEKYDTTLSVMAEYKDMNQLLDDIIAGVIPNVVYS